MNLIISTPGRICLFGEHQDYLGLPVIASAISLRIFIEGKNREDLVINISLPDINTNESFYLNGRLQYEAERDYFKSAVNVLLDIGFTFSRGRMRSIWPNTLCSTVIVFNDCFVDKFINKIKH
jgi:galactokinase